jgi:hypothetical protein
MSREQDHHLLEEKKESSLHSNGKAENENDSERKHRKKEKKV